MAKHHICWNSDILLYSDGRPWSSWRSIQFAIDYSVALVILHCHFIHISERMVLAVPHIWKLPLLFSPDTDQKTNRRRKNKNKKEKTSGHVISLRRAYLLYSIASIHSMLGNCSKFILLIVENTIPLIRFEAIQFTSDLLI